MTVLGELCCVALPSLVVIVHVCGSKMHIQFEETPYKLTEEINCFDTKHVGCAGLVFGEHSSLLRQCSENTLY